MALLASIGMEYIEGHVRRATAVKEALAAAKQIATPVSTKAKAKAKVKK